MALPTAFFLDTSILDGQQYNYSSAALSSFVPVARERGLKLLLPDPTEREIRRHIDARSKDALDALELARRKAPFLSKWKDFPPATTGWRTDWEVKRVATKEWGEFLNQFNVVKLNYEGVDIEEVMGWYDSVTPPFRSEKGKKKEFPDAFAIAILAGYASRTDSVLAVVSADPDFRLACGRYSSLMYFSALPAFTELMLADSTKIESLRQVVLNDLVEVQERIAQQAGELPFVPTDARFTLEDAKVHGVIDSQFSIVGIGSDECTVAFDVELEVEVLLSWEFYDHLRGDEYAEEEWVLDKVRTTGSVKLKLNHGDHRVEEVLLITLDDSHLDIDERPKGHY
jgi:hypothetical protein